MIYVAVAATLLLTASPSQAAASSPACPERALTLRAEASPADPSVIRVSVTNRGGHACTVSGAPGVTFEDLDGSALPVPAGPMDRYRLGPDGTAHATVRTVADPAAPPRPAG